MHGIGLDITFYRRFTNAYPRLCIHKIPFPTRVDFKPHTVFSIHI